MSEATSAREDRAEREERVKAQYAKEGAAPTKKAKGKKLKGKTNVAVVKKGAAPEGKISVEVAEKKLSPLANEINARWPKRDHESDGTIGDAAHASRKSDHNPWVIDAAGIGVVRARDLDEDLDGNKGNGYMDAKVVFDHLLALARAGDDRLNGGGYLIYEKKIYSERNNWQGRDYTGSNDHDHHLHISFSLNAAGYDSTAPWGIFPVAEQPGQPTTPEGPFMALTDKEQRELLLETRANKLRLIQLQDILVGDNPKLGDVAERALASLKRIEKELDELQDEVDELQDAADKAPPQP